MYSRKLITENVRKRLKRIWADVLDLREDQIESNDNFFILGGDSLLMTQVLAKVNGEILAEASEKLQLSDLFGLPTISELAYFLSAHFQAHSHSTSFDDPYAPLWQESSTQQVAIKTRGFDFFNVFASTENQDESEWSGIEASVVAPVIEMPNHISAHTEQSNIADRTFISMSSPANDALTRNPTDLASVAVSELSEQAFPLSNAQKGIWFLDQLEGDNSRYNTIAEYSISGKLNVDALRKAFTHAVQRHEALRTNFIVVDSSPQCTVTSEFVLPFKYEDWSQISGIEQESKLVTIRDSEARTGFKLDSDLMIRIFLIKTATEKHVLLINIHHIVFDAWSAGVLVSEISHLYSAYSRDGFCKIDNPRSQFKDYVQNEERWLSSEECIKQLSYWGNQLKDYPTNQKMKLAGVRLEGKIGKDTGTREYPMSAEEFGGIKEFCRAWEVTPFIYLETIFALLVGRLSENSDIVIGTPVADRTQHNFRDLIGYCVNMLPLRTNIDGSTTFAKLLETNKLSILSALDNQAVPFNVVVEKLNPERRTTENPYFQVCFAYQNNRHVPLSLVDLTIVAARTSAMLKFHLMLEIHDFRDTALLVWHYPRDTFGANTVDLLGKAYLEILRTTIANPYRKVGDIRISL